MKELKVNANLYLELKEGETQEQAELRLFRIMQEISENGFTLGEFWDAEIQEV